MTEEELAVIEARWEKATPGEWVLSDVYWKHVPDQWYRRICRATSNGKPSICDVALMPYIHPAGELASRRDPQAELDFEAIAHARTDIPALVAEVRRLRGERQEFLQLAEDLCKAAIRAGLLALAEREEARG